MNRGDTGKEFTHMSTNQKDLLLNVARKMRESADMIDAACGECPHTRTTIDSSTRTMGQKVVIAKCDDCGETRHVPVEEMRPGPSETFTPFNPATDRSAP